ncbi:Spherulation-specific family 4 [Cercophora newfieldiana]|uniref:Spherulation-specific family 4 n=1 Tax=Cercophora newfieldiana TaxID=92897 RepID=A0AA39Y1V8_9PEZI|nr:Spherulation-specific family 4 [Cercophora newfieldiana]
MIPEEPDPRPFVLVPLYIYPSSDSWEPLFAAARSYPTQGFVVVVNPDNGPGSSPAPDCNYLRALLELSSLANVTILGYIFCSYGDRPLIEIEAEIRVYRDWGSPPSGALRIDGVFVDEVPSEQGCIDYLSSITHFSKQTLRSSHGGHAVVIYNPGIFVEPNFYEAADYIVVFENAASEWGSEYVRDNLAVLPPVLRGRSIAIAHSQGCIEEQRRFREDVVSAGFAGHFSTGMPGYTRFCANWEDYVRDADGGSSKPGEVQPTVATRRVLLV